MRTGDEAFLVAAAQRGDVAAFDELVRRTELPVYRLALRMLGSPADAEDATQDAFLRAWRSLGRFRGTSSFSTWMYRVTTNRCLSVLATRREAASLHDLELADRSARDPGAEAERRATTGAVLKAIGQLPAEQRAALVLRDLEGLSYEEVADVLELSLPAVKGRIHRARLAVAGRLEAWR